jgi:hypothetical protein
MLCGDYTDLDQIEFDYNLKNEEILNQATAQMEESYERAAEEEESKLSPDD